MIDFKAFVNGETKIDIIWYISAKLEYCLIFTSLFTSLLQIDIVDCLSELLLLCKFITIKKTQIMNSEKIIKQVSFFTEFFICIKSNIIKDTHSQCQDLSSKLD